MSKLIAIDAGHGMNTAGKRCLKSIDTYETREWALNDRIADRLQELLSEYDCKVLRVDDTTGAKDIALSARVKAANTAKADVYISIHHNAGINGGTGGGTVVYYYSAAAVRAVQAQKLYDSVVGKTGLRGNRSSKVINKAFYVIQNTSMPAFLIENGFMDSRADTPIILTAEHAEKTAQGILAFLVEEFEMKERNYQSGSGQTDDGQGGSSQTDNSKNVSAAPQTKLYYSAYIGPKTTLAPALASLGVDSSYSFRKKIAAANSIAGYIGTAAQNTRMYNLLVAGLLRRI